DHFMDWLAVQYISALNIIHYMHDKYSYEASQTTLFAVGDDWQAIYRFSGAQMSLTTAFHENFGEGDR
ncbi:pyruvate formate lyase family protein, partial [Escherichia coli]|uniref:pyruvate formate lyase family protein n=1 Tax=Escherichia coli TaxID=562 RepID=UPI00164B7867